MTWPAQVGGSERLEFLHRHDERNYRRAGRSLSFPDLSLERVNEWMRIGLSEGHSVAARAVWRWVAER